MSRAGMPHNSQLVLFGFLESKQPSHMLPMSSRLASSGRQSLAQEHRCDLCFTRLGRESIGPLSWNLESTDESERCGNLVLTKTVHRLLGCSVLVHRLRCTRMTLGKSERRKKEQQLFDKTILDHLDLPFLTSSRLYPVS